MIIIGIHDGHGASAALIVNGRILSAVEEERFVREKGCSGYPKKAVEYLKSMYPKEMGNIDKVAVATTSHDFSLYATKRYPRYEVKDFLEEEKLFWKPKLIDGEDLDYIKVMTHKVDLEGDWYPLKDIQDYNDQEQIRSMRQNYIIRDLHYTKENIVFVDHHMCHAHHAYFSSPISENALIITMDGAGDGCNCTVNRINKKGYIENLYRTNNCNIGRVYQYVTLLLGMKPAEHEYKVMGLAAYSKEHHIKEPLKIFEDTCYVDELSFAVKEPIANLYQYFEGYRFDAISGALQRWTEKLTCQFVENWIHETGLSNVVFSGGVALNIKASKKVAELPSVNNMFVSMAGGDESISIGAAQFLWNQSRDAKELQPITKPYLSAGFSQNDIIDALEHPYLRQNYRIEENTTLDRIAEILSRGFVVGYMSGNMEFGPRSLGHRSILADPRSKDIVATINETIKNRDFWMPFTPSILDTSAELYLINPKKLKSPYMTMAFNTTDRAKTDLAAAIHSHDGTVRPQIVSFEYAPKYYKLIVAFKDRTGVGALLNTSFNIHGKPIVYKPIHAIEEVLSHELVSLKYVAIENVLLIHK